MFSVRSQSLFPNKLSISLKSLLGRAVVVAPTFYSTSDKECIRLKIKHGAGGKARKYEPGYNDMCLCCLWHIYCATRKLVWGFFHLTIERKIVPNCACC